MMYYEYTKSALHFSTELLAISTDFNCPGVIIWIVLIFRHYCSHNEELLSSAFDSQQNHSLKEPFLCPLKYKTHALSSEGTWVDEDLQEEGGIVLEYGEIISNIFTTRLRFKREE